MRHGKRIQLLAILVMMVLCGVSISLAAYQHGGQQNDSVLFTAVYADKAGTKLDSCTLCHSGGTATVGGKTTVYGNCQWCHYKYGYHAPHGDIQETLNAYGKDFMGNGRSQAAIIAIADLDSDGDGYSNQIEIAAGRYPGDANDDPSKVAAPYRVYTLEQLEEMEQHGQFLLMNASKSDDSYVEYSGVPMSVLLNKARILPSATKITVFSPDGYSMVHPLAMDPDPSMYHVNGTYPQSIFYYDTQADMAENPGIGWCNYSAPSCEGRNPGDIIYNEGGLQMLLAFEREGEYLTPGVLGPSNKLDGEGPFRVVPPQKNPGPPDQRSTASNPALPWPYDSTLDHNAGSSARSATMIRVEPLPTGTTDIDILEAGWNYIDAKKVIVYGAVDPLPTVKEKMRVLVKTICSLNRSDFRRPGFKMAFTVEARAVQKLINKGLVKQALRLIEHQLLERTDGCAVGGSPDRNDWIIAPQAQTQVYWPIHEIAVLLKIAL